MRFPNQIGIPDFLAHEFAGGTKGINEHHTNLEPSADSLPNLVFSAREQVGHTIPDEVQRHGFAQSIREVELNLFGIGSSEESDRLLD